MKKKHCIIISHKLRSVKNLDKIFVMSKGKIIAEGNHELLINSCANTNNFINLINLMIKKIDHIAIAVKSLDDSGKLFKKLFKH